MIMMLLMSVRFFTSDIAACQGSALAGAAQVTTLAPRVVDDDPSCLAGASDGERLAGDAPLVPGSGTRQLLATRRCAGAARPRCAPAARLAAMAVFCVLQTLSALLSRKGLCSIVYC